MNIDKLIKREAPSDSEHDKAYAAALKIAYEANKNLPKTELLIHQDIAKALFARNGSSHQNVARCMIIYELLNA